MKHQNWICVNQFDDPKEKIFVVCPVFCFLLQFQYGYLETRPIRSMMRPLVWLNKCMMIWLMTCSFSLNCDRRINRPMDRPSCRDAQKHLQICSGLFMAFPGCLVIVEKHRFSRFFDENITIDDSPTDLRTVIEMRGSMYIVKISLTIRSLAF